MFLSKASNHSLLSSSNKSNLTFQQEMRMKFNKKKAKIMTKIYLDKMKIEK